VYRAQNFEGFTFQYHWKQSPNIFYMLFVGFGMILLSTMLVGMTHMLGSFLSIAIDPGNFNQWPPEGASSWLIIMAYAAIVLLVANFVRFKQGKYTGWFDAVFSLGTMLVPFLFAAIFQ
jgi:hypothetical protein